MKNRVRISFLALSLALAGCHLEENHQMDDKSYVCGFEELGRWSESPRISREMSHTGQFCTLTDSAHEYTQTFVIRRGDLQNNHAQTIEVEAWVLSPEKKAGSLLVASVEQNGKSTGRGEAPTDTLLSTANHWEKIKLSLKLEKPVEDGDEIKVYGWYRNGGRVYWDDFIIRIY